MSEETQAPAEERRGDPPHALRLSSIAPAITVNDLDASLAWYCDVVGFTIGEKFEHEGEVRGASLVAGAARLMLSKENWAKGRDRVKGQGLRLYMSTNQDVDDVAAAIKARGGELASEPTDQPWGARTFDLVDPDGFLITISSGG